jgi:hypothetical protein
LQNGSKRAANIRTVNSIIRTVYRIIRTVYRIIRTVDSIECAAMHKGRAAQARLC